MAELTKWCGYCRLNTHTDAECWSTRPANHKLEPGFVWRPETKAPRSVTQPTPSAESAPKVVSPEIAAKIDAAVRARRITYEPGWNEPPKHDHPPQRDCACLACTAYFSDKPIQCDFAPATPPSESDRDFEQWYVENAFDYERNPLGCRDCGLQRKAWEASRQHFQPSTIPLVDRVAERLTREAATIPEARVMELALDNRSLNKSTDKLHAFTEGQLMRFARLIAREATGGKT